MKKTIILIFISLFVVSCMDNHFGKTAEVNTSVAKKLLIIHTTDSHSKYFPFWMEPNIFDRDEGLSSNYAPCWDLNYKGTASYCDGALQTEGKNKGKFKFYDSSVHGYVYLTEQEMNDRGLVSEDFNRDGFCDVKDCQRCWDKNHNNRCDANENVDKNPGCGLSDCEIQKNVNIVAKCWDTVGPNGEPKNGECDSWEDINADHKCDFKDCALTWDRNHNFKCDFPWSVKNESFLDKDGNPIDPKDSSKWNNALKNTEDTNHDGKCTALDYHPSQVNSGGVARVATIMKNIIKEHNNIPYLKLDSGDTFQGAPEFNLFKGEVEMRSVLALGMDAMVIGNHEFDNGTTGLVKVYSKTGGFPLLAANYIFDHTIKKGLGDLVKPYIVFNRGSLKIGVVGIANDSSMTSLGEIGNGLGFLALNPFKTAQEYVDMLRSRCDLIILLSHEGLDTDFEFATKIKGVDIILGGHHHVILHPVKVLRGPEETDKNGNKFHRNVLIVHDGVNFKTVGSLEVIIKNQRVLWYNYEVHPVTDSVKEDATMKNILEPYKERLNLAQDLHAVVGKAKATVKRTADDGGDSPLGDILGDSLMSHDLVRAQFAVTNTLGIRADIPTGDISREKLYEVFPFENSISFMYLNGKELKEMFDYIARRSASRGCKSQVQVAGLNVTMDCSPSADLVKTYGSYALTKYLKIGDTVVIKDYKLIQPDMIFKMATNDYMARGGSGFDMLKRNTTNVNTSVSLRDAFVDYIKKLGEIDPSKYINEHRIKMEN